MTEELWMDWHGTLVRAKWIILLDGSKRLVPWWH